VGEPKKARNFRITCVSFEYCSRSLTLRPEDETVSFDNCWGLHMTSISWNPCRSNGLTPSITRGAIFQQYQLSDWDGSDKRKSS
jgi:hypothetical protein